MSGYFIRDFAVFTLASVAAAISSVARADDFSAGTFMAKMPAEQRAFYIEGIIEGLAFSRFEADGKKTDGMKCIYDWFYNKPDTLNLIFAAMGKYPTYTPGAIIGVLVKKDCGA